jgi:hypothetical protein
MPQVSLYVDEETLQYLENGAREVGCSLSRYVVDAVKKQGLAGWPADYEKLFGCLGDADFPSPEELRADIGWDSPREVL